MALSEAEEKWLEDRDAIQFATGEYLCGLYPEMLVDDFQDAAEFEARVAEKLATVICSGCEDFNKKNVCPLAIYQTTGIYECRMMHARLAVEADMDGGSNE